MDLLQIFPHLNATLNGLSGVFLLLGFYFIRNEQRAKHRASMLAAFTLSGIFLVCYLAHHALRTYYFGLGPTQFRGEGIVRPLYFTVLTTHSILAALVAPFILVTLWQAVKGRFRVHKKIARLVYPVWLYVSVTGVIVYLMLYQLYSAK